MDAETSASSYYDGSDSSSIPASPAITIEMDSPTHQRSFNDNVFIQTQSPPTQQGGVAHAPRGCIHTPQQHQSLKTRSSRSAEPTTTTSSTTAATNTVLVSPTGGAAHLNVPEQGWYRPGRSVSPASPRVSPSPKTMKAATPNLSIRVTPDSPEMNPMLTGHSSGTNQLMISPRLAHHRRSGGLVGPPGSSSSSRPHSAHLTKQATLTASQTAAKQHTLTVPGIKTKDADSMSSLSSGYYPGSSRSGTNSPSTPDALQGHKSWYLETPPDSPHTKQPPGGEFTKEASPSPFHRTSSTHRPLGVSVQNKPPDGSTEPSVGDRNQWQQDKWRHWKDLAQDRSEEFHGQETLV